MPILTGGAARTSSRAARRPTQSARRAQNSCLASKARRSFFELDAIAAVVIGGTSLAGGVGRITGTVIGVLILGVMTSGFTFIRIDACYHEMVKGAIIVAAVIADQYRQRKRRG